MILPPLTELNNLETLVLFETPVSDLSPLAELKKLKSLDLTETQASDLSPLRELNNLKRFVYSGSQVSDAQMHAIREALPDCNIHDSMKRH